MGIDVETVRNLKVNVFRQVRVRMPAYENG